MKNKLTNLLIIIILLIITFLICMQSTKNIFSNTMVSGTDSSVFSYIGLSMAKGYIPYLELFDHKGLILYFINYIGVLISPNIGVWIIEFIFMFTSVFFSYKLARRFISKPTSLFVTVLVFTPIYNYFQGGNLTEEYALPFQIISLYIIFGYFFNSKKDYYQTSQGKLLKLKTDFKMFNIPMFIAGICCACVMFLRANMIAIWIVFSIIILIYCISNKKYLELLKIIFSFICGILLITIPIMIYLIKNGALESFINDYILFNMKYSSKSGEMAKISSFISFFNTTIVILSFIIIIMKIYLQIKQKQRYYFNLGYFVYMIVNLLLISMSGQKYEHYGISIIPMLIYPYCIMYEFLQKENTNNIGTNLIITAILLCSIVIPTGLNFLANSLKGILNTNTLPPEINRVVDYIVNNTNQEDMITVVGNKNIIYNITNRKSASKYSYQIPIADIDNKIITEYIAELEENKPKLIILSINLSSDTELTQKMRNFIEENNYQLILEGEIPIYEIKE